MTNDNSVIVRELPEKLTSSEARRFFDQLEELRNGTRPRIVFDFAGVRELDTAGIQMLLQCLEEASLPTRALARSVIGDLAADADIYIRRAVADHAMQIFHIDREFLLLLLRQMRKDPDQAIRLRLQPVALRLAEVWLVWYAETAGLVDSRQSRQKALAPFGE